MTKRRPQRMRNRSPDDPAPQENPDESDALQPQNTEKDVLEETPMGDAHQTDPLDNQVDGLARPPALDYRETESIDSVSTRSVADRDELESVCSVSTVQARSVSSVIKGLSLSVPDQGGPSQKWRIPKRKAPAAPMKSLFCKDDGRTFAERVANLKSSLEVNQQSGSRRGEQPPAKKSTPQAAKKPRPEYALNGDDRRISRDKTKEENLLAFGVLPKDSPKVPVHPLADRHPLGKFVGVHEPPYHLDDSEVTLPTDRVLYPMIGEEGYRETAFVRKLFNTAPVGHSLFAFQTLESAVFLREASQAILDGIAQGRVPPRVDNPHPLNRKWQTMCRAPPSVENARACLFQIVFKLGGRRLVMQSMDHLVYLPNRRDLTFVILDEFGTNLLQMTRGLEDAEVAIGDFVWVYGLEIDNSVKMVQVSSVLEKCKATNGHFACADMPFFWRATAYAPVERGLPQSLLGFVLATQLKENRQNQSKVFTRAHLAIQGSATPTSLAASFFKRRDMKVVEHSFVHVEARGQFSNAARFSEPPSSIEGFEKLCSAVRFQIPPINSDAIFPLDVRPLDEDMTAFIDDLLGDFRKFQVDKTDQFRRTAAVFAASASALAAEMHLIDDREAHQVVVSTCSPNAHPLTMTASISGMDSSRNWAPHRKALLVFDRFEEFPPMSITATVFRVGFASSSKTLTLSLQADSRTLSRAFIEARKQVPNSSMARLAARVRLLPENMDTSAEFKAACSVDLLRTVPVNSLGYTILENVFQRKFAGPQPKIVGESPDIIQVNGRDVVLTEEQKRAISLVRTRLPVSSIQAAPGSGKTFILASTLALEARSGEGTIIATAVTNMAVAALTQNFQSLNMVSEIPFTRFVSESARPNLSVERYDLVERLKQLRDHPFIVGDEKKLSVIRRFCEGRSVLESYARDPAMADAASEEDRSNFLLAEGSSGSLLRQAVRLFFEASPPKVIFCTIASYLRLTGEGGLFQGHVKDVRLLACDEASQIGEISLAALVTRSPSARQVYIGDRFQLPPYTTLSREALPARIGAAPILETIERSVKVPRATLSTCFRSHPAIVELSNVVTYGGTLQAGATSSERDRVCRNISLPNRSAPIVFIEVSGEQMRTPARSFMNAAEADAALALVEHLLSAGFEGADIAVLSYYKCQQRAMEDLLQGSGVEVATIDSIQGREKAVIVILTTRTEPSEDLSFLADARRLNVALTRPREGLFILGSSVTVGAAGEAWLSVVSHCDQKQLFVEGVQDLFREVEPFDQVPGEMEVEQFEDF